MSNYKFETLQVHAGQENPDPTTDANPFYNIGGTVIISIVIMTVGCIVWNRGVHAYESAGS